MGFLAVFLSVALAKESAAPKVRWWFPNAHVSASEIDREIDEIADAGYAGAEISFLPTGTDELSGYGWDRLTWRRTLERAFAAAERRALKLDLPLGPAWPLSTPSVASLRDQRVSQELLVAEVVDGWITPPTDARELVAVTAAQVVSRGAIVRETAGKESVVLERATVADLTSRVVDGRLRWHAPAGEWRVFAFWRKPTGQTTVRAVNARPAYVIDHFNPNATRALIADWEARLTRRLRKAIVGADFFGDSIELSAKQLWTHDFAREFRRRRGYDLTPLLPVLHIANLHASPTSALGVSRDPAAPPDFAFTDGSDRAIRDDYYRTLNELMEERHLAPLRKWAATLGARLRYQPAYGTTLNMISNTRFIDVPETESLHAGGQTDFYRAIAGAAHVLGRPVVSIECCARLAGDYGFGLREALSDLHAAFVGGVNAVVFHGRAVRREGDRAAWPGWHPFAPAPPIDFSEAWDSRQPFWSQVRGFNAHVTRLLAALQEGEPRVDIAIYRESFWWPSKRYFFAEKAARYSESDSLERAGFTYDFVDPALFADLALDRERLGRPRYRAFVIDRGTRLAATTLTQLRAWASAGLAIVIVDGAATSDATRFRRITNAIEGPRVRHVASADEVSRALDELGIRPSARPVSPPAATSRLLTVRRESANGARYFVHNAGDADFDGTLEVENGSRNERMHLRLPAGDAILLPVRNGGDSLSSQHDAPSQLATASLRSDASPNIIPLNDWHLVIEDFTPQGHSQLSVGATALRDWREFSALKDVSGIGHYSTTFTLDTSASDTTEIHLGEIAGDAQITINGQTLRVNPFNTRVVISAFVKAGPNTLVVHVATPLRNRLLTTWQRGWREAFENLLRRIGAPIPTEPPYASKPSGLLGPATLQTQTRP